MQIDFQNKTKKIQFFIDQFKSNIDWNNLKKDLVNLKTISEESNFWDNHTHAQKIMKKIKVNEEKVRIVEILSQDYMDLKELLEIVNRENEISLFNELNDQLDSILKRCEKYSIQTMFDEKKDIHDCFLEIHSGAGGTEAQDWAMMLQRMYYRWSEKKGFNTTLIEESFGEEAGIKSSTIKVSGEFAFGWCRTETGVHRLVRISPFDSSSRRHTSFASVWVYPDLDEQIKINLEDKDLKIDTYRASGAGGQHVNKTDSAIRITHLPTNIVVQCQNDRSQHRNKAQAISMLKAKLYELEMKKKDKENEELASFKNEIGWGSQIRSYVLHPYNMVKDLRTNHETGDTNGVLDGNLDPFINKALIEKV